MLHSRPQFTANDLEFRSNLDHAKGAKIEYVLFMLDCVDRMPEIDLSRWTLEFTQAPGISGIPSF